MAKKKLQSLRVLCPYIWTYITFSSTKKAAKLFTTKSHYRGHSAIVQHNTGFTTLCSWMTVDDCLVEYKYKLLHQLICIIAHRLLYTSLLSITMILLQGRMNKKCSFCHRQVSLRSCCILRISNSLSAPVLVWDASKSLCRSKVL